MSEYWDVRIPGPARANAWPRRALRRAAIAVLAGVACLVPLVVMHVSEPQCLAGVGDVARYESKEPWFPGCPLSRTVTRTSKVTIGSFWVSQPAGDPRQPEVVGACGCRFLPNEWGGNADSDIAVWAIWPHANAVVQVEIGDTRIEVENSFHDDPTAFLLGPIETLPWTQEIAGTHYTVCREWEDAKTPYAHIVAQRPVRWEGERQRARVRMWCQRAGFLSNDEWNVGLEDRSSFRIPREVTCPHAHGWTMTVDPEGGEPVTVLFPTLR